MQNRQDLSFPAYFDNSFAKFPDDLVTPVKFCIYQMCFLHEFNVEVCVLRCVVLDVDLVGLSEGQESRVPPLDQLLCCFHHLINKYD